MTMEPDKVELAAQALLEVMIDKQKRRRKKADVPNKSETSEKSDKSGSTKPNFLQTSEYYHQLSGRIRQAYASSRQRTLRFLCYCEQQLRNPGIPLFGAGSQ